ncbi:MAG: hypothetical protein ACLVKO_01490 [Dysgonomonas sp.]
MPAQSFLKKLSKGIEDVSKELDKLTDSSKNTKQTTINEASITYSSPSNVLKVDLEKIETYDDKMAIEFMLTNTADTDIKLYNLLNDHTGRGTRKTYAIDNLGGRAPVVVYISGRSGDSWVSAELPAGIPLRVTVRILDINPKATSFKQICVYGFPKWNSPIKGLEGGFLFKNVPINRIENEQVAVVPVIAGGSTLNIPKKKGIMSLTDAYDQYDNRKRMGKAEQASLTKAIKQLSKTDEYWLDGELSEGVVVYEGEAGTLKTILSVVKDHASKEYLISFDKNGKLIDYISVGIIGVYAGDRGESVVEGNKVTAHFSAEGTSYYEQHEITPSLKFKKIKEWEENE